jgi:hypothetical protein
MPENPLTPWGDLRDDQPTDEQLLWKSTDHLELIPNNQLCSCCGKKLVVEHGKTICPLHGTRGAPK